MSRGVDHRLSPSVSTVMMNAGSGTGRGLRSVGRENGTMTAQDLLERVEIIEQDGVFAVTARHVRAAPLGGGFQRVGVAEQPLHGIDDLIGRAHRNAESLALDDAVG